MLNFVVYHLSLTPVFIELLLIILKVLHFEFSSCFTFVQIPAYAQVWGIYMAGAFITCHCASDRT